MVASRRQFFKVTAQGLVVASALPARLRPARAQGSTVRIGTAVLGGYSLTVPILVALDRGLFQAAGVAAEFQPFQGGPTLLKARLAKQMDIGVTGATDVPVFRGTGASVRYIATQVKGNHFTLNVAPGIGQLSDLKGQSIGVTVVGSNTWSSALMLARREGWDPEREVKLVPLGGLDAQLAARARREIHAFVWGDGGAVTELAGKSKVLLRFDSLMPKWISQAYYATDEYIKQNRDPIGHALRALFQAVRFIRESPKDAAAIAARALKWPEEAVARANQISGPLLSVDGQIDVEAIEVMQTTLVELKVQKQRLPTQDLYTTEFTPVRV